MCIGKKQKWYLLRLIKGVDKINFSAADTPEFDCCDWVSYWYPLSKVVSFKREVYRKALKELVPIYNRTFAVTDEAQANHASSTATASHKGERIC